MKIERFRDLTLIDLNDKDLMVIACDSTGGIGSKEHDLVQVPNEMIGYTSSIVALMEVVAYGAKPVTLVNNFCVEMEPTGREIIKGVKKAVEGLEFEDSYMTGTTEENIETSSTGVGITVIGMIDKTRWERPRTRPGQLAVAIGIPKVAYELLEDQERTVMNVRRMVRLKELGYISEILPVGSKGISYELTELCKTNGIDCELEAGISLDLAKTAGPATVSVASLDEEDFERLKEDIDIPVTRLGRFIERE